jgi:hypothetical protein
MGSWHWGPPSSFLPNTVYESGSTPENLGERLEHQHPGAAASLREGLEEKL